MYATTRRNPIPRQQALLRRKSPRIFETDSPPILCNFLRAQGWTALSFGGREKMAHMLAEHMGYGEVYIYYDGGMVLAKGDEVINFFSSLVAWCGGDAL